MACYFYVKRRLTRLAYIKGSGSLAMTASHSEGSENLVLPSPCPGWMSQQSQSVLKAEGCCRGAGLWSTLKG